MNWLTGWLRNKKICEYQDRTCIIEHNKRAIYREKPSRHTPSSVCGGSNWTTRHITSGCWSIRTVTIIFGVYNRAMSGISLTGEFLKPPPQTDVGSDLLTLVNLEAFGNIVQQSVRFLALSKMMRCLDDCLRASCSPWPCNSLQYFSYTSHASLSCLEESTSVRDYRIIQIWSRPFRSAVLQCLVGLFTT